MARAVENLMPNANRCQLAPAVGPRAAGDAPHVPIDRRRKDHLVVDQHGSQVAIGKKIVPDRTLCPMHHRLSTGRALEFDPITHAHAVSACVCQVLSTPSGRSVQIERFSAVDASTCKQVNECGLVRRRSLPSAPFTHRLTHQQFDRHAHHTSSHTAQEQRLCISSLVQPLTHS